MKINHFQTINLDSIEILRDQRQREEITNLDGLIASIKENGLQQPIIINKSGKTLIAGERRLTSFKALRASFAAEHPGEPNKYDSIPFVYAEDLSESDAQVLELIENFHRAELPWQNLATSVFKLHQIKLQENPDQTNRQTAASVGMTDGAFSDAYLVGKALIEGKVDFSGCVGIRAAKNILTRLAERQQQALEVKLSTRTAPAAPSPPVPALFQPTPLESYIESKRGSVMVGEVEPLEERFVAKDSSLQPYPEAWNQDDMEVFLAEIPEVPTEGHHIIQADFLSFAASYSGTPFNFLHIDFPYGINFGEARRQNTATDRLAYEDSPELYWTLCEALRDNLNTLVAPEAHVMFWFSLGAEPDADASCYERTRKFFSGECDFTVNAFPLIWCRNASILPDPKRGPRRGYETAFILTRGDRKIVRPTQNFFMDNVKGEKSIHTSEKPSAMLDYFFSMFVDESTRMLDPTAGSGSAIRAARRAKAEYALGLEIYPEFVSYAQGRLAADINDEILLGGLDDVE